MYLFHFQLLCGQAVVIGFVWMAHPKRCSRSRSREPEPKPIPTPGTAPTRLPLLLNRAAKPVVCTSTTPLGRWVANVFSGAADLGECSVWLQYAIWLSFNYKKPFWRETGARQRPPSWGHTIWEKTACLCFCVFSHSFAISRCSWRWLEMW